MPQPSPPDRPDAGEEVILGIATHKDVHAAVVISLLGVVLGRRCFSTTASGYESLLDWARGFGALRRAGVECTGSYGKALTRYLRAATGDIAVIEVNKPDRLLDAGAARPTPSMPRRPRVRCCRGRPAPRPRPVTETWRCCGRSSWPSPRRSSLAPRRSTSSRAC